MPPFRRFGGYTAYGEGWGLYSEKLCKEMGAYQDPYRDFGRLQLELHRAIRLVVDSGLHHKRWSREKAIQYVEQPLPAHDLTDMQHLRQVVAIPIAADEAVYDLQSARRVLTDGAAEILIVKPQLAGGLQMARRIIEEAAQHRVPCVITSTIETGIGLVAALHLAAALPLVTLECGLATLPLLADYLVIEDIAVHNGALALPRGPGLGVKLDRVALARYALQ